MPLETSGKPNNDINSENIFDEFTGSQDIQEELDKNDKKWEKDIYYYLGKFSGFLLTANILLFLTIIAWFWYVYVQSNDSKTEYSFLAPVCNLFLWSTEIYPSTCYGVTSALNEYNTLLDTLSEQQSKRILPLLWDTYSLENFNLSKKVAFLLEKSNDRLRPLEILGEFDTMKNIFSPTDKSEISCYDISIAEDSISMTCDSFSSDWNTDIVSVENTTLKTLEWWGTSISKASSFIDFFERYPNSPFEVTKKPEKYGSESFQSWPYTQKTTFRFELLYTGSNTLETN